MTKNKKKYKAGGSFWDNDKLAEYCKGGKVKGKRMYQGGYAKTPGIEFTTPSKGILKLGTYPGTGTHAKGNDIPINNSGGMVKMKSGGYSKLQDGDYVKGTPEGDYINENYKGPRKKRIKQYETDKDSVHNIMYPGVANYIGVDSLDFMKMNPHQRDSTMYHRMNQMRIAENEEIVREREAKKWEEQFEKQRRTDAFVEKNWPKYKSGGHTKADALVEGQEQLISFNDNAYISPGLTSKKNISTFMAEGGALKGLERRILKSGGGPSEIDLKTAEIIASKTQERNELYNGEVSKGQDLQYAGDGLQLSPSMPNISPSYIANPKEKMLEQNKLMNSASTAGEAKQLNAQFEQNDRNKRGNFFIDRMTGPGTPVYKNMMQRGPYDMPDLNPSPEQQTINNATLYKEGGPIKMYPGGPPYGIEDANINPKIVRPEEEAKYTVDNIGPSIRNFIIRPEDQARFKGENIPGIRYDGYKHANYGQRFKNFLFRPEDDARFKGDIFKRTGYHGFKPWSKSITPETTTGSAFINTGYSEADYRGNSLAEFNSYSLPHPDIRKPFRDMLSYTGKGLDVTRANRIAAPIEKDKDYKTFNTDLDMSTSGFEDTRGKGKTIEDLIKEYGGTGIETEDTKTGRRKDKMLAALGHSALLGSLGGSFIDAMKKPEVESPSENPYEQNINNILANMRVDTKRQAKKDLRKEKNAIWKQIDNMMGGPTNIAAKIATVNNVSESLQKINAYDDETNAKLMQAQASILAQMGEATRQDLRYTKDMNARNRAAQRNLKRMFFSELADYGKNVFLAEKAKREEYRVMSSLVSTPDFLFDVNKALGGGEGMTFTSDDNIESAIRKWEALGKTPAEIEAAIMKVKQEKDGK